ncbi:MAG TPA: hypothetical protein VI893_08560 [Thermoplasmata archaeon]|nr:hypothetical protein [Thermoplasmata archaeon]
MKPDEVGRILDEQAAIADRRLMFSALLARESGLSGSDFIVVGGSAIEIYTRGAYVSGDIDLIAKDEKSVHRVLQRWGFERPGRLWIRQDWGIAVDVVRSWYRGDVSRTREVTTKYGNIRLAAVEDLLVTRLAAFKHWKVKEALEEAVKLITLFAATVDWAYIREEARKGDLADVLSDLEKQLGRRD